MPFASIPISSSAVTAFINFVTTSVSGDTVVVPAQGAGVKIKVLAAIVTVDKAAGNDIVLKSGTTDISASFSVNRASSLILPISDVGWFVTMDNQALNINLASANKVGCHVIWVQAA